MEKEVHETVRLLDGLKLGAGRRQQSPSTPSTRQLSRQQKQEKELMQSLKQSLKQTQRKSATVRTNVATPSTSADAVVESSEQPEHAELSESYTAQLRVRPANDLKAELSSLGLSDKGRKPDLVIRLAEHLASRDASGGSDNKNRDSDDEFDDNRTDLSIPTFVKPSSSLKLDRPVSFAGIPRLSNNAAIALHQAFGEKGDEISSPEPTPIQSVAIPHLFFPPNPSALLHAPTGSGKTIAYLLPITETLWKEIENDGGDDMANGMALILLPTRELAAQVAGVASVLAPPGMVRLVPRPMDLMSTWNYEVDRGEEYEYLESLGEADAKEEECDKISGRKYQPRIFVGSAKAISTSLFGDTKMPGTPTSKPEGKQLLSSVRWLVMDEVDRLLNIEKSRSDKKSKRHEKPAALLAAAVARLTVGRAQIIAASATIGRPLRRELSRVLGLHSSECPETLRGEEDDAKLGRKMVGDAKHVGRAVKIPDAVRNFVLPVDGSTAGSLLTSAAFASKAILQTRGRKVLLVLTRNCDIKVHNALGALRHFGIHPEPQSLLDVLEADGTDRLVEAHRRVSRVEGVGGARDRNGRRGANVLDCENEGYLLITHEDNVRGLHLDGLDAVIVVGRPGSPDEYTHIAGRVGRAGRRGSVLNIVSFEQAAALASWTMMLGVDFLPVEESEIAAVVDD
jgi:superfamily II DNA/RNA helicase